MIGKLFARLTSGKPLPRKLSYERARDLLETEAPKARLEMAGREDVSPEILYYLANDNQSQVRRAIAANPSTPVQADQVLADDADDEVRMELARKIGRLVPGLADGERSALRERMIEVLEKLADDQLPRVRRIVAEEIKSSPDVPRHLVLKLAHDVELVVCAPVLEYSPLLDDHDLKEIIATSQVSGALTAIARRAEVSEEVSDAISATLDVPAVAALLANSSAQIREETLDSILDNAAEIEAWHKPVSLRPGLSERAMRRIAGFVAASLVDIMVARNKLPEEVARSIVQSARARIRDDGLPDDDMEKQFAEAEALFTAGKLDDEVILNALEAGRRDFIRLALALMAGLPRAAVDKIVGARSGKAVTALAWKAGLAMRTAYRLQTDFARVPHPDLVNARGGFDYPLSEADMDWQLSFFAEV